MNELKDLINKEEFNRIFGLLQPHAKLRLYLSELKEKVLSLEEPKPVEAKPPRRRRSTIKKEKVESENV